jgi:hypothetical protein
MSERGYPLPKRLSANVGLSPDSDEERTLPDVSNVPRNDIGRLV